MPRFLSHLLWCKTTPSADIDPNLSMKLAHEPFTTSCVSPVCCCQSTKHGWRVFSFWLIAPRPREFEVAINVTWFGNLNVRVHQSQYLPPTYSTPPCPSLFPFIPPSPRPYSSATTPHPPPKPPPPPPPNTPTFTSS